MNSDIIFVWLLDLNLVLYVLLNSSVANFSLKTLHLHCYEAIHFIKGFYQIRAPLLHLLLMIELELLREADFRDLNMVASLLLRTNLMIQSYLESIIIHSLFQLQSSIQ